ncbi:uncharacterized protein LOC109822351 [Asparagus officinalis]|uniref:uncharacterized protein LOC109822351 n=1 Tax=Asparagus officinalis TaxID=4686 RepID=UPI00098E12CA|nr:uncharacterized protein LOC109822351 [Asparagus officinalis]
MASSSEIVLPIGTQKHDPAWKHCLMIRAGGRTMLKCMYCQKKFLGGGIHRIKEHLARHKGNASCCPKVPIEVQQAMQQSLDGSAVRKKRKMKLVEEVRRLNPNQLDSGEVDGQLGQLQVYDVFDTVQAEVKEDALVKPPERGRKRKRHSPPPLALPSAQLLSPCGFDANFGKSYSGVPVDKDQAYMAIFRCLYESGAPLDILNSKYFQPMIDAIAAVGGLQKPSYHDANGYFLKRMIEEVNGTLERYRATWSRTGCSILADEWTTDNGKTLINFLVYCPEGTMFLKSVDASHIVNSADTLYELLKHVVEEVGVKNVVQVITNNTESHVIAGKRLSDAFSTLFWTPCASQCIDGMLEDIGKLEAIAEVIENAKSITSFIYNHGVVLNMMKKYTNGRDLLLPCEARSAMNFLTLKSMISLKEELRAMVASEEWMECPYSKKPLGIAITNLINSLLFWPSCAAIVRITEPLVQVLKLVDSSSRPAMGYIHVGMTQVKEAIKKELVKKQDYTPYWEIIDWRWDRQLPRPLHSAAFFLNPRFFYSIQGEVSNEISSGMLDCIERLVPEVKIQDKIQKELHLYKSAAGDFGRKMAVRARHTLLPAEWWSTYGGACPNLTRLAIRILSQACSARVCGRNHIPFEQIHNQRMNCMEHQRLSDLIFVRYNLRLQQRQLLKSKPFDPISVDNIDIVDDWTVEKNEMFSADEGSSWMVLDPPATNGVASQYDEGVETFILGLDDEVIQRAGQDAEEDDDIKEEEDSHDDTSFAGNFKVEA